MNKESKALAKIVIEALEDKKAENITVYDISSVSALGDYFIIANGTNKSQIQALADNVDEKINEIGMHAKQIEGYDKANWILLDYRDVIVHIFDPENRDYYSLERLWRDAEEISIDEI